MLRSATDHGTGAWAAAQYAAHPQQYASGVDSGGSESTGGPGHWQTVHDTLMTRSHDELSPAELDQLARALFWLNEPARSIEVHQQACRRWQQDDQPLRAARSTWFLFYEHWLVGEDVVARGWLERGHRLVESADPDRTTAVAGWLGMAHADVLLADGRPGEAAQRASESRRAGERLHDADLTAMALQVEGRALVADGHRDRGLARLDDAMVSVIGNELDPLYTGWVYCNVIGLWHAVGDVRRATEWSDAALRWCESLAEGLLYPGLCRVYAAELAQLRGDWDDAETQARRAAVDLAAYDDRYAGAAHYVLGDLSRLRGRLADAETEFAAAADLGRTPLPGSALLAAQRGHHDDALAALRGVLDEGPGDSAAVIDDIRAALALAEVAAAAGADDVVGRAAERVGALAGDNTTTLVDAYRETATGRAAIASTDPQTAVDCFSRAVDLFDALSMPYDAARGRLELAAALHTSGDPTGASVAASTAEAALAALGADSTGARTQPPAESTLAGLSEREREVLALAATGLTNQDIGASLHVSQHTVARHLANIYAKLGVGSRTAAASMAVAAGLVRPGDGQS